MSRFKCWLEARRWRKFHAHCDRLGVPMEVRERAIRGGATHIDWYAGRQRARVASPGERYFRKAMDNWERPEVQEAERRLPPSF